MRPVAKQRQKIWRGGRAVECSGLENRQGFTPFVGSNPTLSARYKKPRESGVFCIWKKGVVRRIHRFDHLAGKPNGSARSATPQGQGPGRPAVNPSFDAKSASSVQVGYVSGRKAWCAESTGSTIWQESQMGAHAVRPRRGKGQEGPQSIPKPTSDTKNPARAGFFVRTTALFKPLWRIDLCLKS